MDTALTAWINSFAGRFLFLDSILIAITTGGHYLLVGLVVLRWWSKKSRSANRHVAIRCGISTAVALAINQVVLLVFHRVRPYDAGITHLLIEKSADPSFPSDHATVAFAVSASLFLSRDKWRVVFVLLAVLVCVSRIYVGTHYATDILGGVFIGILAAFVVARFYHYLDSATQKLIKFF